MEKTLALLDMFWTVSSKSQDMVVRAVSDLLPDTGHVSFHWSIWYQNGQAVDGRPYASTKKIACVFPNAIDLTYQVFHLVLMPSGPAKVFDDSLLTTPHAVVGNGQHIPCAALALCATLLSVELFPEVTLSRGISEKQYIINVSADGRCFFSCCFLCIKGTSEQQQWLSIQRNQCGFPLDSQRMKHEDTCVSQWFLEFVDDQARNMAGNDERLTRLQIIREKFAGYVMPEHDDICFFVNLLQVQLVIVGHDMLPSQTEGGARYLKMHLVNSPSIDGAGKERAHFRFVYVDPCGNGQSPSEAGLSFVILLYSFMAGVEVP